MPLNNDALHILIVDDDADVRQNLAYHLNNRHHQVALAQSAEEGLARLQDQRFDLVITDVRLPGMDGFELLAQVRQHWPQTEVIVITGFGDIEGAVRAMREGGFDYLSKPLNVQALQASLQRLARFQTLQQEKAQVQARLEGIRADRQQRYGLEALVGESAAITQVKERIQQVAQADQTTVLILGETGTGKELVARAIHYESRRASGPFVAVDCSSIPASLIESELFGHVKGAFTDARTERKGHFEQADGGTLFLDEIGDMALALQTRLLRTLEERQVRRLGSSEEIPVDVRVISATNQVLDEAMAANRFRRDLYFRLQGFTIELPPLRQRPEDIMPIARHYLKRFIHEVHKPVQDFSLEAQALLASYGFPGNVRELKNLVEQAVILCQGGQVQEEDLDLERLQRLPRMDEPEVGDPSLPSGLSGVELETLNLAEAEAALIRRALAVTQGNQAQAAQLLGISRMALSRRMKQYHIDKG